MISGIKTLKMMAWEGPYLSKTIKARNDEMKEFANKAILESLSRMLGLGGFCIGILIILIFSKLVDEEMGYSEIVASSAILIIVHNLATRVFSITPTLIKILKSTLKRANKILWLSERVDYRVPPLEESGKVANMKISQDSIWDEV